MNQTINISLPKTMLTDLHDLVEAGHFATVSEAIRAGINQIKTTLHPKYRIPTYPMPASIEKIISDTQNKVISGAIKPVHSVSDLI